MTPESIPATLTQGIGLHTEWQALEQDYLIDDGLVERLLAALSDALRRTRPDPFRAPVSVAEIYQDLVPYRTVRTALGFQMNADYEHTVLRLLSGEADLARLEPEEAREELRAELEMPNPNVGLFRKFAACDVWILRTDLTLGGAAAPVAASQETKSSREAALPTGEEKRLSPAEPESWSSASAPVSPAARPAAEPPAPPESASEPLDLELEVESIAAEAAGEDLLDGDQLMWAEDESDSDWDSAEDELLLEEEVQDRPAGSDTSEQPAAAGPQEPTQERDASLMFESNQSHGNVATAKAQDSCVFCQGSLPGGRVVRFCPFCGMDQTLQPCSSCREPLEPSWKFCIACGNQQT